MIQEIDLGALKIEDINYTYDDYKLWEGDWELIDGIPLSMAPAPTRKHQSLATKIIRHLDEQLDSCNRCEVLGEIDYKVCEDTLLRPDIVLTCDEQNDTYLTKAPEIVVEIISKSTAKKDEKYKFDIYETQMVNYYIIVYPDDLVAKVYKNKNAKFIKQGDFSTEKYKFENTTCDVEINFELIFSRYR